MNNILDLIFSKVLISVVCHIHMEISDRRTMKMSQNIHCFMLHKNRKLNLDNKRLTQE